MTKLSLGEKSAKKDLMKESYLSNKSLAYMIIFFILFFIAGWITRGNFYC